MITFLFIFITNCLIGIRKNEQLAQKWYFSNSAYLEDNYAHLGTGSEYNTKSGVPILKESYNNFKFYASGRVFTKWLLVAMDVNI
jgi:hypothetical protein